MASDDNAGSILQDGVEEGIKNAIERRSATAGLVALVLRILPPAAAQGASWLSKKLWSRIRLFFEEYARAAPHEPPAGGSTPPLPPLPATEEGRDALVAQIRAMLDLPDPAVVPVLARIAREYDQPGRKIDAFFRGISRMLCEITADELDALRQLLDQISFSGSAGPRLELHELSGTPPQIEIIWWTPSFQSGATKQNVMIQSVPHARRLFFLLKHHGIGEENVSGFFDATGGPGVVVIEKPKVDEMRRLLRR